MKLIKIQKMKKLKELYVLSKMPINEFNSIEEKIKKKAKEISIIDQIKKIYIDSNRKIEVYLNQLKELSLTINHLGNKDYNLSKIRL